MDITLPVDPKRVCFAGDWHGNTRYAQNIVKLAEKQNVDMIVQLGDFGIWAGESGVTYLNKLNKTAEEANIPILFIDGNHENFDILYEKPVNEFGLRQIRDKIWHIPRGSRFKLGNSNILAVGGATSLDRLSRTEFISWWVQESVTEKDFYTATAPGVTDVLLVHDCPEGTPIPGIDRLSSLKYWPESELRVAWNHRELLETLVLEVKPKLVLHGHFHVKHDTNVNYNGTATRVIGLADDGNSFSGNMYIVDVENLPAS